MRRYHILLSVLAALLLPLSGCSMDAFRKTPTQLSGDPEKLKYASSLQVDLRKMTRTASGLYYLDRRVGTGPAAEQGRSVKVAYVGSLANGEIFDQSGPGRPIEFMLGEGEVIRGWDEGITGMKVGGQRLLVIRPELAYGGESPGAGIPPHATLVFDLVLEGVGE